MLLHIIETVETSREPRIRKAESAFDNMALFASVALSWLARQDNGFEINSASWTCLDIQVARVVLRPIYTDKSSILLSHAGYWEFEIVTCRFALDSVKIASSGNIAGC